VVSDEVMDVTAEEPAATSSDSDDEDGDGEKTMELG
jgi:hypothetical protein